MTVEQPGKPGRIGIAVVALLGCLLAPVADALTASVDRSDVHMGETLQLTIRSNGETDPGNIDLSGIEADFQVLNTQHSDSRTLINGQSTRTRSLLLELTPRREGDFRIPALTLGGERSEPIPIRVRAELQLRDEDEILLFDVEVDREQVYVQGQLLLTFRIQQAVNLESRSVTELKLDNAYVATLGQNSFQRTLNGRPWLVHEIRYAIFPETSGELTIPPQAFSGRLSTGRRSLFDTRPNGQLLRRETESLRVSVLPRPDTFDAATWLPAAELTVEEQWSDDASSIRVGDSITRTVTLTGKGLQGAQLPPLSFPTPDGVRAYPDQPLINDIEGPGGLTGIRSDSVAMVPVRAGEYRLPPITIAWWDTKTDQPRTVTLPERHLTVKAATPAAIDAAPAVVDSTPAAAPSASNNAIPGPWPWIAGALGIAWLLTLGLLLKARRPATTASSGEDPTERNSRRTLLTACRRDDPALALRSLYRWTAAQGGGGNPSAWAAREGSASLVAAICELQAQLFSGAPDSAGWRGKQLAAAVEEFAARKTRREDSGDAALPPLYPATSATR